MTHKIEPPRITPEVPLVTPKVQAVYLIIKGVAVNSDLFDEGVPTRTMVIRKDGAGVALLMRTIRWAIDNDVEFTLVNKAL